MDRGFLSNVELRTWRGATYYGIAIAVLIIISLVALFPFFFAFTSGLKGSTELFSAGLNLLPQNPQWGNYVEAWQRFNLPRVREFVKKYRGQPFEITRNGNFRCKFINI